MSLITINRSLTAGYYCQLSININILMLVQCHTITTIAFTRYLLLPTRCEGHAFVGQLKRYAWPDSAWTSFGHLKMILGIAGISTNRGGRSRSETDILSGKWNYETERRIPWSEWGKYGSGHPCEIIEYLSMREVWGVPWPRSHHLQTNGGVRGEKRLGLLLLFFPLKPQHQTEGERLDTLST